MNMEPLKHRAVPFDPQAFFVRRKRDMSILLAGIVFGIALDWMLVDIALFALFLWSIVGPIASRWLAIPALFFLAFTPLLLFLDREKRAEEFAVYAYYFLVMAVIRGLIEARSEHQDEQASQIHTKKS